MLQDIQEVLLMLTRIKQYFCGHDRIETRSETGLSEAEKGWFFVKTLISCTKCGKSFAQHPRASCCYVMHLQNEMIKEWILSRLKNKENQL